MTGGSSGCRPARSPRSPGCAPCSRRLRGGSWCRTPRSELVTAGRGTELTTDEAKDVLENDYVTAARTPDGHLAVIYLPTQRTISVNTSAMAAGTQAAWIDPTSGARRPVPMSATFTTPGTNAEGRQRLAPRSDLVSAIRPVRQGRGSATATGLSPVVV